MSRNKDVYKRQADGEPIAIMTSYVPAKLVPSFDISVLSGSLYDYYDQLGLPRLRTKSRFTAIPSDEYLSEHLEVEKNTALLKHDHITYTIDNEMCIRDSLNAAIVTRRGSSQPSTIP